MIACDFCGLLAAQYGAVRSVHARQKVRQSHDAWMRDLGVAFIWDAESHDIMWTSLAEDEMLKAKSQVIQLETRKSR